MAEPNIEVKAAGFFVVPLADVYVDGVRRYHNVPLREAYPADKDALIDYAVTNVEEDWAKFEAEYPPALAEHLANGDAPEEE